MSDDVYVGVAPLDTPHADHKVMEFIAKRVLNSAVTMQPVKVIAVNGNRVDVQPMVHQLAGDGTAYPHGTVHGWPYFQYQGGTSAFLVSPVVGDIGIGLIAMSDISSVKENAAPSNPGSRRKFDWADGVYVGGLFGLNPAATQFVQLDDAGVTITSTVAVTINAPTSTFNGDVVVTGKLDATGEVMSADDFVTNAGVSLNDHVHSGVQTGGGDSGPPVT